MTPAAFGFGPVTEADFDELLALRLAVLRALFHAAPAGVTLFRVGALRDSDANGSTNDTAS